ncbi:MAG: SMI1/KNR4 family protein [Lachnospiraceae bacterium]
MNWKYKIELDNKGVFSEIEKDRGIKIPKELEELVVNANAATPEKCRYMLGNDERIVGAILSFNKEDEADSVFLALNVVDDKNLLPFAIDPFGNFICLDIKDNTVVYWNHEINEVSSTGKNLSEFIESLY